MERKKLNIAVYTSGDFPYGGAAESFVRQMALGLYENGCDVEVIRWRGKRYQNENDTPIKLRNYLFKRPASNDLLKLLELLSLILFIPISLTWQRFIKKDQIILLYGLEYVYIVLPFIIWSKLLGLQCFRIITDQYRTETIAPVWWKQPKLVFYRMQQKYFDKYLDGIVVLSRYLYNACLQNKVKEDKLLLIPHFIDLGLNINKTPHQVNRTIIGFCGNPSIGNGILDLVNAFILISETYPNAELLVIGKISNDVEHVLNKLQYHSFNIRLTGLLGKKEVEHELNKCTILVNPRRKGIWADAGFPTKLGEYFATKKPVVSTNVGDLKYYFTDKHELVFAEPENYESLAKSIIYLIGNANLANEIGRNGFYWADAYLDYDRNAKRLINFLNSR